ncbi:MAG: HAD family hydrolase [Candidatus Riflebacteria bacterium]|nr:HAD family hydrolase [Candidatus Riflebacteria bacterium]
MSVEKLRLVTFDLDGTLFANAPYVRKLVAGWFLSHLMRGPLWLFRAVLAARAFQKARDELRTKGLAPGLHECQFRLAAQRCGYPEPFVREVVDELIYSNPFTGADRLVFPGAREALTVLKSRGLLLGVLSDYPVPTKLVALDLAGVGWDVLLSAEDVDALKPHPALFLAACERVGVAPEAALHVGDRPDCDVAGARAAGLRTLLFKGQGPPSHAGPRADYEAASFDGIRLIVESLLR